MNDHRDFEEPLAAPDVTPEEKSTRQTLTICLGILLLAGIAFASIGTIGQPMERASLTDANR